eukprot:gene35971-44358_t
MEVFQMCSAYQEPPTKRTKRDDKKQRDQCTEVEAIVVQTRQVVQALQASLVTLNTIPSALDKTVLPSLQTSLAWHESVLVFCDELIKERSNLSEDALLLRDELMFVAKYLGISLSPFVPSVDMSVLENVLSEMDFIVKELVSLLSMLTDSASDMQLSANLLYRGSRDGFQGADFHSRCDGVTNTLTLVRDTDGNIFGGYSDFAWDSGIGKYLAASTNSFVFSLRRKGVTQPVKLKSVDQSHGCPCTNANYLPTFGGGYTLHISSGCNTNNASYSAMSTAYYELLPGTTTLSNERQFIVQDIEVYQVDVNPQHVTSTLAPLKSHKPSSSSDAICEPCIKKSRTSKGDLMTQRAEQSALNQQAFIDVEEVTSELQQERLELLNVIQFVARHFKVEHIVAADDSSQEELNAITEKVVAA